MGNLTLILLTWCSINTHCRYVYVLNWVFTLICKRLTGLGLIGKKQEEFGKINSPSSLGITNFVFNIPWSSVLLEIKIKCTHNNLSFCRILLKTLVNTKSYSKGINHIYLVTIDYWIFRFNQDIPCFSKELDARQLPSLD